MRKALIVAALLGAGANMPLAAQSNLTPRVEKLEKEMRAVQRKVFPGGSPDYFEPQISAQTSPADPIGAPATTPIADLTARVNAIEATLESITAQTEQNSFKLRQLEEAFARYRSDVDARIKALESAGTVAVAAPAVPTTTAGAAAKPPAARPTATTAAGSNLSIERAAQLDAIQKPSSSDPAEDDYVYGYRLWEAKFYPEAQAQLKFVVEKYPKHKRASYAQNLLGRAYLDEGKPALASVAFYDSYQKMPKGDRAPDSLVYLGQALIQLKKPADACKVYDEFDQVYGATASASLKALAAKGRTDAKCK